MPCDLAVLFWVHTVAEQMDYVAIIAIALAALALQEYRSRRHSELIERLIEGFASERAELLLRIQAPELTPTIAAGEPSEQPLYVPEAPGAWDEYVDARAAGKAT